MRVQPRDRHPRVWLGIAACVIYFVLRILMSPSCVTFGVCL